MFHCRSVTTVSINQNFIEYYLLVQSKRFGNFLHLRAQESIKTSECLLNYGSKRTPPWKFNNIFFLFQCWFILRHLETMIGLTMFRISYHRSCVPIYLQLIQYSSNLLKLSIRIILCWESNTHDYYKHMKQLLVYIISFKNYIL